MTTPRRRTPPSAAHEALVLVGIALMSVALIWLAATSRLAAVGVKMDRLCHTRTELLRQRSEALAEYASATDPAVMEQRARSLALRPMDTNGAIAVAAVPSSRHRALGGALGKVATVRLSDGSSGPREAPEDRTAGSSLELAVTVSDPASGSR